MAVNIKMGVDTSGFKQSITDANAQLKTLDAQLKLADATMKATGNSEQGLVTKTNALSEKLKTQKQMIQQYEKALENMRNAGVDPLSKDYQKLATALLNTKAGMVETEAALNNLNGSEQTAISTTNQLTDSMNSIGKKVSLEQVRSGIESITSGLENAAKKAVQLGEKLLSVILDSAAQADDISTMATRLGLTETEVQQINYNAARFEVTAEQLGTTWKKVKKNMASDSKEIVEGFEEIGVKTHEVIMGKDGLMQGPARDYKDVFWETGDALLHLTDAAEQEALAQKLLGRSWDELLPLFKEGRETYEEALKKAPVASEEAVENMASLNDRMAELEASWDTLKLEALGAIAPALEKGADAIAKLLDKVTEYLKTDAGQELLERLGTAVSGLFDDLSEIDPQQVVEGFTSVFEKIVGGFQWLYDHKDDVVKALEYIVIGWAGLKLTGGALDVLKVINGAKNLTVGSGDGTGTGAEGTGTGNGSGGGFWSAENLLNKATLFAAANAMYEATERQIRSNVDNFNKATEGMTDQQRQREALKINFGMTDDEVTKFVKEKEIDVSTEFVPEDDAAKKLADDVGVVVLPAQLHILGGTRGIGTGGENLMRMLGETVDASYSYANGLPFVPYDGYLARLHKGERVVPAREVAASRNFSSNLYVESMYMSGGADAEGLASAMAAAQRRTMSGYGS